MLIFTYMKIEKEQAINVSWKDYKNLYTNGNKFFASFFTRPFYWFFISVNEAIIFDHEHWRASWRAENVRAKKVSRLLKNLAMGLRDENLGDPNHNESFWGKFIGIWKNFNGRVKFEVYSRIFRIVWWILSLVKVMIKLSTVNLFVSL